MKGQRSSTLKFFVRTPLDTYCSYSKLKEAVSQKRSIVSLELIEDSASRELSKGRIHCI